jgi:ATP-dependent Clp protease ATP-binding subunit ClpC
MPSNYLKIQSENLVFEEPSLEMPTAGRLLSRLISYSVYAVATAGAITLLMSDIEWLFWLGALISAFLLDRLFHANKSRKNLSGFKMRKGEIINAALYFEPKTITVMERARDKSLLSGKDFSLYLLFFLSKNPDVKEGLERMDVSTGDFIQKIDSYIAKKDEKELITDKKTVKAQIERIAKKSFELGLINGKSSVEPIDLFGALAFANEEKINRIFNLFSIDPDDMETALIFGRFRKKFRWTKILPATLGGFAHKTIKMRPRSINRAWTSRPTPILDKYGTDFTDLARKEKIGFLVGHENEYRRMTDILSRPTKANALLIGEPGVGKETIVAHLAFEIIKDKVPPQLFDKRLVSLQIGNLVSGAAPEEIAQRINRITDEIISAGNIILYIPDMHNLAKTSGSEYLSAADILLPVIISDAFPVVGSTYPKEFKQLIEPQSDFAGAFEPIRVEEITPEEGVRLLTYYGIILENQYRVVVSFGAIKQAVAIARKYFKIKPLPSSAADLLKETLADCSQRGDKIIQADDIIAIAERKINVPIHRAGKTETEKLLNLENIIHKRLVDQEEAVKAVSRSLREYRSGLSRSGGPISVFLFVGPTGVGKTELSKILADVQFGSENMMVRFDMSEYQDKQSIFRFIGSPDGRLAGNLTESIIQKPYSLILLDEFEKAHPDILNLFLQLFDEGRLTDNLGRTIDFTNTIIIATSNAHSEFIKSHIEAGTPIETISEQLKKKLTDFFRPELLNRFSNVIVFKTLSQKDIIAIAELQLEKLASTLEETHGISISFSQEAVEKIAQWGFDPVFGARPLRGAISEKVRSPLAEKILKGELVKGSQLEIVLSENKNEIEFKPS